MQETINGRYILQNEIGAGGMGVVFEAYDRLTNQMIALKRVRLNNELQLTDSYSLHDSLAQLRLVLAKEFQTLAGLRHPNIISVIDYGFDSEQQPFYTMTLLTKNETILEFGSSLDFEGKINLIEQLLLGLVYLHRRGILHRDIKPENVLIADGTVRLLDFGLSQKVEEEGVMGGSPLYMAPELFDGEDATQAADLYAVGILLFQLLTDQHPFGDYDEGFLERAKSLDLNLELIDARLHPILNALLASSPKERASSASLIIQELAKALGHQAPAETDAIRESYLQAASFVGRQVEINRLATALKAAKNGKSSAWLIGGESGVGKSRLLDELQTMALVSGWQIWRGQAAEVGGLSYQMWRDIVPKLVLNTDLSSIELSILKEVAPHIDRLIDKQVPAAASSNGSDNQDRLILTLISALKRQTKPTLILLEDVHWARESLAPIIQIISLINNLPNVMVVATYRSDERPNLPKQLPEAQLIALSRLSDIEIQQLSHAMLGDRVAAPEIVSLLTQETEGNTFFIIEVMRALAEEAGQLDEITQMNLPAGVLTSGMEDLLNRRIQKIPPEDQNLLQISAVTGRQLDLSLLEQFVTKDERDGWLQRGLDAAVLSIRDDQWFFSHDKLRETITNGIEPATLRVLHRNVAEAIEQLYPEDSSYYATLMEHWHIANDLDKEIGYLEPVAKNLVRAFADITKAEELLTRGLNLLPDSDPRRVSLLNWLAYALSEQFDSQNLKKALRLAEEAKALAEELNDTQGLATSLYYLGDIIFEIDSSDLRANECVEESLIYAKSLGDQEQISINLSLLGEIAHHRGNVEQAIKYHSEAITIFKEIGYYYGLGYSLDQLGQAVIVKGEYEKAGQYLNQSYEAFQAGGYIQRFGWTLLNAASPHLLLGRYDEAKQTLHLCLSTFQKYGVQTGIAFAKNNLGRIATLTGDLEEAKQNLHESNEIFEVVGLIRNTGYNLLQFGIIYSIEGNFEEAKRYLEDALTLFQEYKDLRFIAYGKARLGIVTMHTDPILAHCNLHESLELAHSLKIAPCILECLFGMAASYIQQGRLIEAGELVGLASHHHNSNKEVQLWSKVILPRLEEALSPDELEQAFENGKSLDFEKVVNLLRTETMSPVP